MCDSFYQGIGKVKYLRFCVFSVIQIKKKKKKALGHLYIIGIVKEIMSFFEL